MESIRFFDVETQLSEQLIEEVSIIPDLSNTSDSFEFTELFHYFPEKPVWWIKNGMFLYDRLKALQAETEEDILISEKTCFDYIETCSVVEWGPDIFFRGEILDMKCEAQPIVNKHFELLADTLQTKQAAGYKIYICSVNDMQIQRLRDIFSDKDIQ